MSALTVLPQEVADMASLVLPRQMMLVRCEARELSLAWRWGTLGISSSGIFSFEVSSLRTSSVGLSFAWASSFGSPQN
jgi:uncharacterized membrane protein